MMKPLALALLLLPGCAAIAYQPPPGIAWAYTAESAPVYALRMVVYVDSKEVCELARAADRHDTAQKTPYLGATYSAGCRQVVIGPGGGYWAFALPAARGQAYGTLAQCEANRKATTAPYVASACAPVSVRFLEPSAQK